MLASLRGADLKEARVTAVIKDVKLLPGRAEPKPAAVNDTVTQDTAVRTGVDSRSELTFADLTIARLGANTIFSFDKGTRTVELGSGAILLRVPKDSGGAKINTAAVTAAITGTTMMAEYHSNDYYKFIMLEGASQVCQPRVQHVIPTAQTRREDNGAPQDCVDLGPGQMLVGKPGLELGKPVDVDIKKLVKTSQLTNGFGTLGSEDLIGQVILAQLDEKSNGTFVDALDSRFEDQTSHDVIDQKTAASETSTPTPSPSGTPTKFGTPPVITSSNLTTIDRGTVITTDPSITRNAETDYGKIYRGPADDGPASAYLFGSTSSFDTASGFDHELQNEGDVPIAVFKFITLTLAGNPSISTANGGALNLGLISVGDMTSAMPGGRLDFPGINKLLLATQNGSIILGPELSFGDLEGMLIYARGAGSALTLGSSFDVGELNLEAEGSIQVNGSVSTNKFHSFSGVDFLGGSGHVTTGRIEITALNNINFNASQFSLGDFENIDVTLNATNVLNIDPTGEDQSVFTQAANFDASGKTINLFADDPFTISFNPAATLTRFTAGTGGIHGPEVGFAATDLQLFSAGDIYIYGTHILPNSEGGIAGTIMAAGLFHAQSDVNTGDLTAGTSIYVGGNLFGNNFTAGTTIDVVGSLSGFGTAMAGGDITADKTAIPTIISPNGILHVGEGGIHPFVESLNNPPQDGADLQHVITVSSIISPAGIDFSGNQFGGISNHSNGGRLTINADTLRFDAENGIGPVSFDGADAHHFSSTSPSDGGDGGIFEVNTSGDIFVGELISATTGLHDPVSTIAFSGAGGRVSLDAAHGMVTVNSTIIVSSNDLPTGGGLHPRHLSASGGEINIHSGLTSGTAITLGAGSALLSLLNDAAPGPGGTITVLSEGGDIFAQGAIEADRGTILISNFGTPGRPLLLPNGVPSVPVVKIDGGSLTAEFGDILSRGDVQIATSAPVDLNVVTLTISAGNDITDNSIVSLSRVKNSSGNVNISAGANIDIDTLVDFERTNDGLTSDGLNLTAHAGQELLVGKTFRLLVDNSGMSLGSGANILLTAGDQIAVGNLNASVSNRDGHITNGGNITVFSAGLTTHSISAQRFNGGGGYTGTGGNIVFGISGDMNVSGDALFSISNSEDAEVPGGEFASAVG
ncbi:MAG: FecR domain-containing protein, partial [Chthoniobacterales bacterium]